YDLDGFKLDFVDSFCQTQPAPDQMGGGRDYDSVSDAVDRLLTDVIEQLRTLKPDILIEFRQTYIGPMMRKYGNMLRAGDAPNTLTDNQVRILDVRLLAGATPVHADMLMWHPDEPVESAAMQVIHTLFGVPQISVRLDQIPDAHREMLRFYLSFWREHRDVLLRGTLHPQQPGYLYPLVIAETPDEYLVAFYGTTVVRLGVPRETLLLINGTFESTLILDLDCAWGERLITIQSCCGEVVSSQRIDLAAGIHAVNVPPGGVATLAG
ncbi:MAG TPA: hypothetical protein VHD90_25375, partial [Phototrophicaceae bacterium]|nr:hypothetical protein [Phototrophicaceae bacterium]